jgi:hypothetical protein
LKELLESCDTQKKAYFDFNNKLEDSYDKFVEKRKEDDKMFLEEKDRYDFEKEVHKEKALENK